MNLNIMSKFDSLSSSEGSSDFKIITDFTCFAFSFEGEVSLLSVLSHCLDVNVRDVINREGLSFLLIEE